MTKTFTISDLGGSSAEEREKAVQSLEDIPAFLKRPVVVMGEDGRLWSEEPFSANEASFGGLTMSQLLLKVAERLGRKMEKAGAIRPYVFFCQPGGGLGYVMRAEEA